MLCPQLGDSMASRKTTDWTKVLARAVRRHRADLGLTQEELAEAAGIHRNYVSRIESGKAQVSVTVLAAVAAALKFEFWDFIRDAYDGDQRARSLRRD
jgi:transcriptional regulator with XRE-family HTH domain